MFLEQGRMKVLKSVGSEALPGPPQGLVDSSPHVLLSSAGPETAPATPRSYRPPISGPPPPFEVDIQGTTCKARLGCPEGLPPDVMPMSCNLVGSIQVQDTQKADVVFTAESGQ